HPFAPALLFTLAAILVAARTEGGGGLVLAGVLCALAAAWRLDFGVYAVIAVAATVGVRRDGVRGAVGVVLTFALATALVYLPFVIADGPADAWHDLVGRSLSQGRYWHLPFPISYDGGLDLWPPRALASDLKDVLGYYIPLLLIVGLVASLAAIAFRRLERNPLVAGLPTLGITYIPYPLP